MRDLNPNSLKAYNEIKRDLKGIREEILDTLAVNHRAPLTAQEIGSITGLPGVWKRLSEMERARTVNREDSRPCSITGRTAATWSKIWG